MRGDGRKNPAVITAPSPKVSEGDLMSGAVGNNAVQEGAITAEKLSALRLQVGQYVRSANYVSGESGWAIDASGTAEFNTGLFRGDILATNIAAEATMSADQIVGGTISGITIIGGNGAVVIDGDGITIEQGDEVAKRIKFGDAGFGFDAEIVSPSSNTLDLRGSFVQANGSRILTQNTYANRFDGSFSTDTAGASWFSGGTTGATGSPLPNHTTSANSGTDHTHTLDHTHNVQDHTHTVTI